MFGLKNAKLIEDIDCSLGATPPAAADVDYDYVEVNSVAFRTL